MTDEKRLFRALRSGRRGEPEATFEYLYTKYKPLVRFVASRYIRNGADIEDITQEAFISFFNHAESIHTSIKTYLTVSAKNIALNFLKKNGKLHYADEEEIARLHYMDFGEQFANDGFNELVKDMKRVLSEEDVRIILLRLVDDVTFDEIALQLNQNMRTVKTKYYRALKKYRKTRGGE